MKTKITYDNKRRKPTTHRSLQEAVDWILNASPKAVVLSPYTKWLVPIQEIVGAEDEFLWLDDPEFEPVWTDPSGQVIPVEDRELIVYHNDEYYGDDEELARIRPVLESTQHRKEN